MRQWLPLLRKELVAARPFLILVLVLHAGWEVLAWVFECPDQNTLREAFDFMGSDSATVAAWVDFLLAFALGSGIIAREREMGTLELLDALPTTRLRVFLAKVAAGFLVLAAGPAAHALASQAFHAASRTSLDPSLHGALVWTAVSLHALQVLFALSLSLALSFVGRFGWLVMGVLVTALVAFPNPSNPLRVFDPASLVEPGFTGTAWRVPWPLVHAHGVGSVLLLGLAGAIFVGRGERLLDGLARMSRVRWGRLVMGAGMVSLVIVCVVLMVVVVEQAPEPEKGRSEGPHFASWRKSRAQTDAFVVTYPSRLEDRARGLALEADRVDAKVRAYLGGGVAGRVAIDATGSGSSHRAGTAQWKSIRIDLASAEDVAEAVAVLGHEATHVHAHALGDPVLANEHRSTRFFDEGLAEHVEATLFRDEAARAALLFDAALVMKREDIRFDELVDDAALRTEHDPDVVYCLGATFVGALVAQHGHEATGRVLKALARPDATTQLVGVDLWRDAFQSAGFTLEEVVGRWQAALRAEAVKRRAEMDAIPRPVATAAVEDWELVVRPEIDASWRPALRCRFRAGARVELEHFVQRPAGADGSFAIDLDEFPTGTAEYQLGLLVPQARAVVWSRWVPVELL